MHINSRMIHLNIRPKQPARAKGQGTYRTIRKALWSATICSPSTGPPHLHILITTVHLQAA